jgi:hypothetical protein
MIIAAFDMGTRNFAFCVEEFDPTPFSGSLPIRPTFDAQGCPTPDYEEKLNGVYRTGRLLECKCVDLLEYCRTRNTTNLYLGLTWLLDEYTSLWDATDLVLIEQQMAYGRHKSNIQALRLAQHCLSYFTTIYGPFKAVEEFASTHKTRLLGCPLVQRKLHARRKQFAVGLAQRILEQRKDPLYELWRTFPKRDDVSDCVLMIQARKVQWLGSGRARGTGSGVRGSSGAGWGNAGTVVPVELPKVGRGGGC